MRVQYRAGLLASVLLAFGMIVTVPARSALGGSVDSVTADSNVMHGQLRATPLVQYDVQEISTGVLTVREYVTRSGQVFAVTWQGPLPPNLRQLLGTYFGRFQSAAAAAHQARPGIHRQFQLLQSDLVVQSSGRLRSFRGIAYLPALIPAGVSVSELQ